VSGGFPTSASGAYPMSGTMPAVTTAAAGPVATSPFGPPALRISGGFPTSGTMPVVTTATIPVLVPMGPGLPMEWRHVTLPVATVSAAQLNAPSSHLSQQVCVTDSASAPAPRSFNNYPPNVGPFALPPAPVSANGTMPNMVPYHTVPPAPVSANSSMPARISASGNMSMGMQAGTYPPPAAWGPAAATGMYVTSASTGQQHQSAPTESRGRTSSGRPL
jgi:hypothetical protein